MPPALPVALPAELCWRVNHLHGWAGLQARLAERSPQDVAVIGAGMIGCEIAEDLARAGHRVTLMDRQSLPLANLLPEPAARRLNAAQRQLGIELLDVEIASLTSLADGRKRLLTRCGQRRDVDQVIAATGLATEPRLARLAGLDFARGISVDPPRCRPATRTSMPWAIASVLAVCPAASSNPSPVRREPSPPISPACRARSIATAIPSSG